jgi:hypothetical protein
MADGFTLADPPPVQAPLRAITAHELLAAELPAREIILSPWLPTKGLAMVYGLRGIGKTHFTWGVGYAIASGGTFLRFRASRPRRVLIIDGEMPAVALQERLLRIVDAASKEPPATDYLRVLALDLQERSLDLSNAEDQAALADLIGPADLVILDNVSTLIASVPIEKFVGL